MTSRQKKRIITVVLLIILSIFTLERLYNSKGEFQVSAMEASHYGIVEARVATEDKLKDFEYLYDTLERGYPFFKVNERLHGIDWLGNKSKYKRMIRNTKNDAEFLVAMQRILGDLNNPHINILSGEDYKWFLKDYYNNYSKNNALGSPFVMYRYQFDGDIESFELYKDPILETKVLIKDELAYMKIKAMASSNEAVEDYQIIKKFIKDVEDYDKLILDIRGNNGGYDEYWINIVGLLINEPTEVNYYSFFKDENRYIYDPYSMKDLTVVNQLDEEVLSQFPEEVKTDFDFYKTYSINIEPNLEEDISFNGQIYLLVDRNVFSSAEKFASFAKDSGFATLVGEPTGGDKVFEEIPFDYLINSKFAFRYSRELGMNADGTINMEAKTIPHIQIDPTPHEDFNKDECIQAVIRD